jgi:hypothetical protein
MTPLGDEKKAAGESLAGRPGMFIKPA